MNGAKPVDKFDFFEVLLLWFKYVSIRGISVYFDILFSPIQVSYFITIKKYP